MGKKLEKMVSDLNETLQKAQLEDLSYYLGNKKRMIWVNFLGGIFRGVGIGIGFTIITAIVVIILQKIVVLNIPVIGDYLSDIMDIIRQRAA